MDEVTQKVVDGTGWRGFCDLLALPSPPPPPFPSPPSPLPLPPPPLPSSPLPPQCTRGVPITFSR